MHENFLYDGVKRDNFLYNEIKGWLKVILGKLCCVLCVMLTAYNLKSKSPKTHSGLKASSIGTCFEKGSLKVQRYNMDCSIY